jgi:GcrA cell cycle regulator
MWAAGYSSSQIGAELGITRNAVMGKLNRLGLSGTVPKGNKVPRPRRASGGAVGVQRSQRLKNARRRMFACESNEQPADQSDCAVSFMDVQPHQCRYPIGEPSDLNSFRFCGAQKLEEAGSPYCLRHTRLCWTPYQMRAERRPA